MITSCKIQSYLLLYYLYVLLNLLNSFIDDSPIMRISVESPKVTSLLWGPVDKTVITGHENGEIIQWDLKVTNYLLSREILT